MHRTLLKNGGADCCVCMCSAYWYLNWHLPAKSSKRTEQSPTSSSALEMESTLTRQMRRSPSLLPISKENTSLKKHLPSSTLAGAVSITCCWHSRWILNTSVQPTANRESSPPRPMKTATQGMRDKGIERRTCTGILRFMFRTENHGQPKLQTYKMRPDSHRHLTRPGCQSPDAAEMQSARLVCCPLPESNWRSSQPEICALTPETKSLHRNANSCGSMQLGYIGAALDLPVQR